MTQKSQEFSGIARGLLTHGFSVDSDFLDLSSVLAINSEIERRRAEGLFKAAKVGRGDGKQQQSDIRRDFICWLDRESQGHAALSVTEAELLGEFETLREKLNRELQLGLWDFEAHYAIYSPGGYYRRHLDRFKSDDSRAVSVVLYLNESWEPSNGGQLVLFTGATAGENIESEKRVVVEPRAGTLVCFLSDCIEHEVLESKNADRISIAGWYRRRALTLR